MMFAVPSVGEAEAQRQAVGRHLGDDRVWVVRACFVQHSSDGTVENMAPGPCEFAGQAVWRLVFEVQVPVRLRLVCLNLPAKAFIRNLIWELLPKPHT